MTPPADLTWVLTALWERKWWIIAAIVLGGLAGYGVAWREPPLYPAEVQFLVPPGLNKDAGVVFSPVLSIQAYQAILNSPAFAEHVKTVLQRPESATGEWVTEGLRNTLKAHHWGNSLRSFNASTQVAAETSISLEYAPVLTLHIASQEQPDAFLAATVAAALFPTAAADVERRVADAQWRILEQAEATARSEYAAAVAAQERMVAELGSDDTELQTRALRQLVTGYSTTEEPAPQKTEDGQSAILRMESAQRARVPVAETWLGQLWNAQREQLVARNALQHLTSATPAPDPRLVAEAESQVRTLDDKIAGYEDAMPLLQGQIKELASQRAEQRAALRPISAIVHAAQAMLEALEARRQALSPYRTATPVPRMIAISVPSQPGDPAPRPLSRRAATAAGLAGAVAVVLALLQAHVTRVSGLRLYG